MAKIQTKVVEREALQWDGTENAGVGIAAWVNSQAMADGFLEHRAMFQPAQEAAGEQLDQYLTVRTQNGWVVVQPNDWVIVDEQGYPYPCHPVTFEDRWEVVDG